MKPHLIVFFALVLGACATSTPDPNRLPKGVVIKKGVETPNPVNLRYYMPKYLREQRVYVQNIGWIEPGEGLSGGFDAVIKTYFPNSKPADFSSDHAFGLFVSFRPSWDFENGKLISKMKYQVFDGKQPAPVLSGEVMQTAAGFATSSFYNAAMRSSQVSLVNILNSLTPTASAYPDRTFAIDTKLLIEEKEPISTGTGFFINGQGQLLTANHVLPDCLVIKIKSQTGVESYGKLRASSALLDVAAIDGSVSPGSVLPFRKQQSMVLGEMVSSIGYPLQDLLAETPNLTRGNISAEGGMKGSLGLFQFSAPIQPGASGGPIISDSGQVLGASVSTLNSPALARDGIVPQNVNFGLAAKHIVKFLTKEKIEFSESDDVKNPDLQQINKNALAATVRIACYQ